MAPTTSVRPGTYNKVFKAEGKKTNRNTPLETELVLFCGRLFSKENINPNP